MDGDVIGTEIDVRRIRPDDWRALRSIRLEALDDTPEAYITTLEEATAFPDGLWRSRARSGAAGDEQSTVLAFDASRPVGLAVGLNRMGVSPGMVAVVSVYVSPTARRRGVGRRVMGEVEAWARSIGASTASLWVVDGNDRARSFYRSIGYEPTLDRQQVTVPPVRWETRFVKDLTSG